MNLVKGHVLGYVSDPMDVRAAKTARLQARVIGGDATLCELTIEDSADGSTWVASTVTLASIDTTGVDTNPFDVDGVGFIRAKVTTASSADSFLLVTIGVQQEV